MSTTALVTRVAKVGVRVGRKYVDQAKKEAEGEVVRIALGIAALVMAGAFTLHFFVFVHAFVCAVLMQLGLRPFEVFGLVAVVDLMLAFLMLIAARFGLLRPLLPRTRKRLNELYSFLTEPD